MNKVIKLFGIGVVMICLSMITYLAGCGGSSNVAPVGTTLTGSVSAPAASSLGRASSRASLATTGVSSLQYKADVTVEAYSVDDSGTKTGNTLATATTNDSGAFTLTLPVGVSLSANLVLATGSGNNTMRCLAVSTTADINPVTELVASEIIASSKPLANFSTKEVITIQKQAVTDSANVDMTKTSSVSGAITTMNVGTMASHLDSNVDACDEEDEYDAAPEFISLTVSSDVVLTDGETITITVEAEDENDAALDYYWYADPASGTLTMVSDTSYTFSTTEPGEYWIEIEAENEYGLVTATETAILAFGTSTLHGGIEGEIEVPISTYRSERSTNSGNTLSEPLEIQGESTRDVSRRVNYADKGLTAAACESKDFALGEFIISLDSGSITEFAAANGLLVKRNSPSGIHLATMDVDGASDAEARQATIDACKALNAKPGVKYVELNGIVKSMSTTPNDPKYNLQWHYGQMNLPQAWDLTTGSSDVIVAVLDTGIVAGHADLSANLTSGYDFVADTSASCDGDGIDDNPEDVSDSRCTSGAISKQDRRSSGYHGSHVAGTIGAVGNNSVGVTGVNWTVKIMPMRVLGAGGGYDHDIIQAMLYAAGLANDSNTTPTTKANIINMSLGGDPGSGCNASFTDAFSKVHDAGLSVFVAGGNEYSTTALNPIALCNYAVAVAAVDRNSKKAEYSNAGPGLTIAAPGGETSYVQSDGVLSTLRNDAANDSSSYAYYAGTSMATPHAAGVAALMLAVNPNLTPDQISTLLAQTATDLGTAGTDNSFGAGLINAYKAVLEAKKLNTSVTVTEPTEPAIAISTAKIYFAQNETSREVILTNTGGGTLSVTSVSDTETSGGDWMSTSTETGTDKITIKVKVNRTDMTSGKYTGTISVESNGGNATIAVTMQVEAPTVEPPASCQDETIFVIAYDEEADETVGQDTLPKLAGDEFIMYEVPAGDYYIVAGTDCNGDMYICDQDIDHCGIYPLEDNPETVAVSAQAFTSDVNFSISLIDQFSASRSSSVAAGSARRAYRLMEGR